VSDPVLRVAVVEDEPLARQSLLRALGAVEWIEVVGEADDGPAATRLLESTRPDLALMDINLPGYGALDVLARLAEPPAVIFVTAYDQHAITAFDLAAIDYVLKPFDQERLVVALERGRDALVARDAVEASIERARGALGNAHPLDTLFVRDRGAIVAIPVDEVVRFEADDIYVAVHARGRRFLVQMALADLERRLPPGKFLRVHRSHVLHLRCIVRFAPIEGGRYAAELADGSRIIASRRYSRAIRELAL
jgi:two-component system, LytTR family, response regulator